jgi:hypothetical protein
MAITVLGILNQKYHQECDDRRTRVDDQLPPIAELEYRACDAPDYDHQSGDDECSGMARGSCRPLGEVKRRSGINHAVNCFRRGSLPSGRELI